VIIIIGFNICLMMIKLTYLDSIKLIMRLLGQFSRDNLWH